MIIDKLENISMYRIVPDHVTEFLKTFKKDISCGRYELIDQDFVNVEEYNTKLLCDGKFEAHNNYIDIQILLNGEERIYYTPVANLSVDTPYNLEKDIKFYSDKLVGYDYVTLNGLNFAMIFPHEAHAPQVCVNETPSKVKKMVIKVKV